MRKPLLMLVAILLTACTEQPVQPTVETESSTPQPPAQSVSQELTEEQKLGDKRFVVEIRNEEQIQFHAQLKDQAQELVKMLEQKEKEAPQIVAAWVQLTTGTEDGRFTDTELRQYKQERAKLFEIGEAAKKTFGIGIHPDPAGLSYCTSAVYALENWMDFLKDDGINKVSKPQEPPQAMEYKKAYKESLRLCKEQIAKPPELDFSVLAHSDDQDLPKGCIVADIVLYETLSETVNSLNCPKETIKYIEQLEASGKNRYPL